MENLRDASEFDNPTKSGKLENQDASLLLCRYQDKKMICAERS